MAPGGDPPPKIAQNGGSHVLLRDGQGSVVPALTHQPHQRKHDFANEVVHGQQRGQAAKLRIRRRVVKGFDGGHNGLQAITYGSSRLRGRRVRFTHPIIGAHGQDPE
jgi:hypothetical protein